MQVVVAALACVGSWLLYFHRYVWGVLTAGREGTDRLAGSLAPTELGWLDAAFSLSYGAGQIPGGWIADRLGPRRVLSASVLVWSCTLALFAIGSGLWLLMGLRIILGMAQAAAFPCISKITRSWFSPSFRTVVQGLVASMSARAGGACASLVVATLLMGMLHLHWTTALLLVSSAGLVYAVVFFLLFRDSPAEHPWAGEPQATSVASESVPASADVQPQFDWSLANRINLAFFLLHTFASAFADNLFVYWLPRFLRDMHHLDDKTMGIYASLPLWGGALGGFTGGVLNDVFIKRTGQRRLTRSGVGLAGKGMAVGLVLTGVFLTDPQAAVWGLFFCKFFSDWSQASLWGTVTDIGGPASGRVFGIVNTAGIVGAFIAGPLMGYVRSHYGWTELFYVVSGAYAVASLTWLFIDCTRPLVVTRETQEP